MDSAAPSIRWRRVAVVTGGVVALGLAAFVLKTTSFTKSGFVASWLRSYQPNAEAPATPSAFSVQLANAAFKQTLEDVTYDPAYVPIAYPGGDVPANTGVCADVVVRAYRALGIDLQVLVHEDMEQAFAEYPKLWQMTSTDTNIDHRRVPNLMTFFRRHGRELPIEEKAEHFRPGNIVAWDLGHGLFHVGVLSNRMSTGARPHPLVIHNIGEGPKEEDVLFAWKLIGNFEFAR